MATTTVPYTPPLQALPPWMSYSTFITTSGATAIVTQAVVNLPLTYYGPPIPLGTDGVWVYGGLTSPAPTSTTTATTATLTTSAASTASMTSTPSVSASSTTPFSSIPSNTEIPVPTAPAEQRSASHGPLPIYAIVLIAVIGGVSVIIALLLILALSCRRRRRSLLTHPDDTDDEITHSGTRFRLLRALPLPRSLRSSMHRHSRVPQTDLEATTAMHPNDSDWHVVDAGRGPPSPTPLPPVPTRYGPIVPYQDDDEDEDGAAHPSTPASHQTQSTTAASSHPSRIIPATVGSGSGSQSTGSLFYQPGRPDPFAHVVGAPGEVLDRDPRVFPDRYSYMVDEAPALVPLAPAPFHARSRSNTTRTLDDSQRTRVAAAPSGPLMAYPDSPVSEVDEGAGLLAVASTPARSRGASGHSSPARSPSPRPPTLVQRLSVLLRRLSGTPTERTTPFLSQASPEQQQPQMKEAAPSLPPLPLTGFGFLNAPPQLGSSSTRDDRPLSTLSGSGQTVYFDARSRPQSPHVDAPPVHPDADLDAPAPSSRRLRYPPGLTPTNAEFRMSGPIARRVSIPDGLELEEEDIVGDLRPVGRNVPVGVDEDVFDLQPPAASGAWTQIKNNGKARIDADEEDDDDRRARRATLGEPLQIPTGLLSAKSPTSASSHFPARSASRSTGSGNSHSSRSRRTGSSSISSTSLRRLQQSADSGTREEPFIVQGEGMPTSTGRRRGPLLSATFGPARSRTPSSHGKSKSRSGSQNHSQNSHAQSRSGSHHTKSRAPSPTTSSPSPSSPNLRSVVSALSLGAASFGQTTMATSDPGAPSVRHVMRKLDDDDDEPLPLTHTADATSSSREI